MHIKILGSGCNKCVALGDNAAAAAQIAGIDVDIEKVTDIVVIAGYGVMSTPCLVIDGDVVSSGQVLGVPEIVELLNKT